MGRPADPGGAARVPVAAAACRGRPDFREHVLGRVAALAALDPEFGATLRAQLDAIDWTAE